MCLFFVGCGSGGPSDENDDEYYQSSLEGVKVLARTTDNNYFSTATGDYSEYYYNIFSANILDSLYRIYEDNSATHIKFGDESDEKNEEIHIRLNDDDGKTFSTFLKEGQEDYKYYLYDSLRYTISNIDITYKQDDAGTDVLESYNVILDLGSAWNWDVNYNSTGKDIVFLQALKNMGLAIPTPSGEKLTISFGNSIGEDWLVIYDRVNIPSFKNVYVGTEVKKDDGVIVDYYTSPFYEKEIEGKTEITAKNFYQDALEYVTYLFVLGYDYEDATGNTTSDALKFDFTVDYAADGTVSGIKVGGLAIETALKQIKAEYKQVGNFVGITETNKKQLTRFILDKVIGDSAFAKDTFKVDIKTQKKDVNGIVIAGETTTETLNFNRNYETIVDYIVDYACGKAPIGTDAEGNPVTLDNAYMASTITDYNGEYFFAADDEEGSIFRYIDAAEYQSMVFMPIADDVGKRLTDIHIVFEYQDYNTSDSLVCNPDGLDLVVGLRYFNSKTGTYSYVNQTTMKVLTGDNAVLSEDNPDINTVIFSEDEYEGDGVVRFEEDIIIGTQFKNPDAINPAKYTTEPIGDLTSMTITGNNAARDYYDIIDSASGVGFYGALKGEKFATGEGACDFIEVYFDIQKLKGATNISYDFKLALITYYAMGEDD